MKKIILVLLGFLLFSTNAYAQWGGWGAFGSVSDYLKRVNTNVVPTRDNFYTLGLPAQRWASVYAVDLYGNGSNLTGIVSGGGGGSGTPGGSNTNIQFNNNSSFGGSSAFTFNTQTGAVNIATGLTIGSTFALTGVMTGATGGISLASDELISGNLRLSSKNCSGFANGGKLTTDGQGNTKCSDDNNSGGTVTSVTGTSPIVSSGGATPAISINTASSSQAGALSASDYLTFSQKQTAFNTSLGLANILLDETGTALAMFNQSPTMTSPTVNTSFTFKDGLGNPLMTGLTGGVVQHQDEQVNGFFRANNAIMTNLTVKTSLTDQGLTASRPVISDANKTLASGSYSGNTTTLATTSGTLTSGNCAKFDASGNVVDNGAVCGSGGGGSITGATTPLGSGAGLIFVKDSTGSQSVVLNQSPTLTSPTINTSLVLNSGSTNILTGLIGGVVVTQDLLINNNLNANSAVMTNLTTKSSLRAQNNFNFEAPVGTNVMTGAIGGVKVTGDEEITNSLKLSNKNCSGGVLTTDGQGNVKCGTSSSAPIDADYLVGTSNATLSNEIIVGTTPGGELGNTWASPTIDDNLNVTGWDMGTSTATTPSVNDNSTKLATTAYVDEAVIAQNYKEAVKYSSTAALPSIIYANGSSGVGATLTGVALAAISLDSSSPAVGERVLIKNQASDFQNGIYTVTATGSGIAVFVLTRATDADQANEYKTGDAVFVTAGTTLSSTTWAYTGIDSPTMGTSSLTYAQIAGQGSFTGGNGIAITGTSIALALSTSSPLNYTNGATPNISIGPFGSTYLLNTMFDETGTGLNVFNNAPTMTSPTSINTFSFQSPLATPIMTGSTGGTQVWRDEQIIGNLLGNTATMTTLTTKSTLRSQGEFIFEQTSGTDIMTGATGGMKITGDLSITNNLKLGVNCSLLSTDGQGNVRCGSSSGATGWTDDGTEIRLDTSTDEVEIGSAGTLSAKLAVNGDTDEVQTLIQGNATQTNNILVVEQSDGSDLMTVNTGGVKVTGDLAVTGLADITGSAYATSFVSDPTNNPQIKLFPALANDTKWVVGVNGDGGNDNDDKFVIAEGADVGSFNRISITPGGAVAIPNLISCDTIDTDVNGNLTCGADATAVGGGTTGTGVTTLNNSPTMTSVTTQSTFVFEQTNGTDILTGATGGIKLTGDEQITGNLLLSGKKCPSGVLKTDGQGNVICGTASSGTPGGADTNIQYNDVGAFGGDSGLTWDKTNNNLTLTSAVSAKPALILNGSNSSTYPALFLGTDTNPSGNAGQLGHDGSASGNGMFLFNTSSSSTAMLQLGTNSLGRLTIDRNGRVGIGTANGYIMPIAPLEFDSPSGTPVMTGATGGIVQYADEQVNGLLRGKNAIMTNLTTKTSLVAQGEFKLENPVGTPVMTGTIGGVNITGDALITNNLRLSSKNCTGFTNNGKLTTDGAGNVICAADTSTAGGAGTVTSVTATYPINSTGSATTPNISLQPLSSGVLSNFVQDETGSSLLVYNQSPTITSPTVNTSFVLSSNGNVLTGLTGGVEITQPLQVEGLLRGNNAIMTNLTAKTSLVSQQEFKLEAPVGTNVMTGAIGGMKVTGDQEITNNLRLSGKNCSGRDITTDGLGNVFCGVQNNYNWTFTPMGAVLDEMSSPTVGIIDSTGFGSPRVMSATFDPTTNQILYWTFALPSDYNGGNISTTISWLSNDTGANETSVWDERLSCTSAGDVDGLGEQAVDGPNIASGDVNTTEVNRLLQTSLVISKLDSAAPGDVCTLMFLRDANSASDDLSSTATMLTVGVQIPKLP